MTKPNWIELCGIGDLPAAGVRTIKRSGHQLAVFRLETGELRAIDNRCPHEGYPLAAGEVRDGVLTCEWHNWKFELDCGKCILGGEDVRAYPLRREGDRIWVDLSEPPGQRERMFAALEDAFEDGDWGWAARSIERLLGDGVSDVELLSRACTYAAAHAPYGFDHGLATTADLAARLGAGEQATGEILLEACHVMVAPNLRRPAIEPDAAALEAGSEAELRAAIESEDHARVEGQVRAAIAATGTSEVLAWLSRAASDHFLGYGHGQIYALKAAELVDRLEDAAATEVIVSLGRSLTYATREDRLPYMRQFATLAGPRFDRLDDLASCAGDADLEVDGFLAGVLDGRLEDALAAVERTLEAGVAAPRVALALGLAAAHRLARFDADVETDDEVANGWLDATHLMTYAEAVAEGLRRWPSSEGLRGLFYGARFIQHAAPLDGPAGQIDLDVVAPDADSMWKLAFESGAMPIFFAHRIKMTAASLRLSARLAEDRQLGGRPDRDLPRLATLRFLESPIRERRIRRRAIAARMFVRNGKRMSTRLGY